MNNQITIHAVTIRQDEQGLFCINDLHKVSGGALKHKPGNWLRMEQTQELIKTLNSEDKSIAQIRAIEQNQVVRSIPGNGANSGTFVCKELVYAYTMWISPKFHIHVIRTFDTLVSNQAKGPELTPDELAVKALAANLTAAALFGCPVHLAQIESVKQVQKTFGVDFSSHLLNAPAQNNVPSTEVMLEPTELAKLYGVSAREMNLRLADAGLQARMGDSWVPTDTGKGMCTRHSWTKGTKSGYNLKWNSSKVKEYLA